MSSTFQVLVQSVMLEADGIRSFDLRPMSSARALPPFTPGAHVDIHLPEGMIRSYSLMNDPDEAHRYVVAVNKDPKSKGGSRFLHEKVQAGDVLTIGPPRNNFALEERAAHSVFIAGGIGITPLWSMIQRLEARGASWELHYACRSRRSCAFLDRLRAVRQSQDRLHLQFDDESCDALLDLEKIACEAPADAHLYCCGPAPMLDAFKEAAARRNPETIHVEYFASNRESNTAGGFSIELARSGKTVAVEAGQSILDALLDVGVIAPYSCREGICGACEVKVIEGVPDHRDMVLSQAERDSNASIFICCSGAKTPRLVLDL